MKPAKALAICAAEGNLAAMRQILAADPDLAQDWQPIMDACYWGKVEAVRLLLDSGADPNVLGKSNFKYRPLHRTIEPKITVPRTDDHVQIVRLLLERGADPMLRATWANVSALAMAAFAGEARFVDLLLPHGQVDWFHAAALGDVGAVQTELARDQNSANLKDVNGWTALTYACRSGLGASNPTIAAGLRWIIEALLQAGSDPRGELDSLVYRNDPALIKLLMDHGARLQDGDTLNHAACSGMFAALAVLVERGVDLNMTAGTEHHGGYTPFGCTLTLRSLQGAKWFLDQGVNPDFVGGPGGETAMHVAVKSGAGKPLLELLASRGAQTKARNSAGQTPAEVARDKGQKAAIEFFEKLS